jgi:hypothetical protein
MGPVLLHNSHVPYDGPSYQKGVAMLTTDLTFMASLRERLLHIGVAWTLVAKDQ